MAKWKQWFCVALILFLAFTAWLRTDPLQSSVVKTAPPAAPEPNQTVPAAAVEAVSTPAPQPVREPARKASSEERSEQLRTPAPRQVFKKSIQLNGRDFSILHARAIPKAQYDATMGPVLAVQSGFVIYSNEVKGLIMGEEDRPVAVNPNNNMFGIVSGTLIAVLHDVRSAQELAARHGLSLLIADKNIPAAFLRCAPGQDIVKAARLLAADPAVKSVETEILFGQKVRR